MFINTQRLANAIEGRKPGEDLVLTEDTEARRRYNALLYYNAPLYKDILARVGKKLMEIGLRAPPCEFCDKYHVMAVCNPVDAANFILARIKKP